MKKLLLLIAILATVKVHSQMTLDFTIPTDVLQKVSFTNFGDKYWSMGTDTIFIYNIDGSIFRQIKVPLNGTELDFVGYPNIYLSDNLFNSDTLIEYMTLVGYNDNTQNAVLIVANELGNVLWSSSPDSVGSGGITSTYLFKMGNDFKMGVVYSNGYGLSVYSLPGSIPCNQCNFISGITEPAEGNNDLKLSAYPNPFSHSLSINYDLVLQNEGQLLITSVDGKELKNIELKNQSGRLNFNTNEFPTGIIIATLYDKNQNLISKKLIKIE